MAIRLSTNLRNRMLDGWSNSASAYGFFDSAIFEIRSGTIPTDADTLPTGTVLASITLPADAVSAAAAGAIPKLGTWQDTSADATGTASWFRIKKAGDLGTTNTTDPRMDGTVGTSGADLNLDNTSINATQSVTINSFTLTQPAT
jgi:hypothetical protein